MISIFTFIACSVIYRNQGYTWDLETYKSNPHVYQTYGAAVSEVEIDCLTGGHTVSMRVWWAEGGCTVNEMVVFNGNSNG